MSERQRTQTIGGTGNATPGNTKAAVTFALISLLILLSPHSLQAKSWKDELIGKITAIYVPTDRSIWDLENIKAGGTVLVLAQDGALGSLSTDARYYGSDIKDGKISTEGAPIGRNSNILKKAQRVVLTSVKIIDYQGSDVLRLFFLTADTFQRVEGGNTATRRYKGSLDYFFPSGYLEKADFAEIKKAINRVIVAESEYTEAGPATVSLGMSPTQVEGVLGKPSKIIELGTKKIFVYSDIKVTFMDGKVTDVQ
jgi:hypothetical protein